MKILIKRDSFFPRCTIGTLSVGGKFVCYTLEDKVREIAGQPVSTWKIARETAIPVGIYKCRDTMSARFKKLLPELFSVPGFAGIRIHTGNTHEDTEGCLIVGMFKKVTSVHNSLPALTLVKELLAKAAAGGQSVTVEIRGLPET